MKRSRKGEDDDNVESNENTKGEEDEAEEVRPRRRQMPAKRSQSALGHGPSTAGKKKKVEFIQHSSDEEENGDDEERNEAEDSEKDTPRTKLAAIQK